MRPTDQDGKSKTSSAIDSGSYPEQNEVDTGATPVTPDAIRARAHELWLARGSKDGSAEQDWQEAEEELTRKGPRSDLREQREENGSVQR